MTTLTMDPRPRPATLYLTRRGRLVVFVLGLLVVLGGAFAATRATADAPASAPAVTRYVVVPGDTLWAIAGQVAQPGQDRRDVVRQIEELNRMPSAALVAGQQILLPGTK